MSTVLFLTTNKSISTDYLKLRKDFQLWGVRHVLQLSKYEHSDYIDGYNYYFDCMVTLFSNSLETYQSNKRTYLTLQKCYKWFDEIVGSLIKNGYEITLSLNSFGEDKTRLKEKVEIPLKLLNGRTALDFATQYLVVI